MTETHTTNCIALENGILDLDWLLAGRSDCLLSHTPRWFSPVCLPYPFDPDADCPTWQRVLEQNLEGDPERLALAQQWAGYLLLPDTSEQKFLFLEGEGGNGKSVYCAGLEAMLGEDNVSHVPLESFGDRFALSSTLGKLANIVAEVGELDKAAEGKLKSFTSGDRMTFDRKGIAAVDVTPTARLVLSANNRPRFGDRSSGLWRRMILMPFQVTVPAGQRIKGMDKPQWWLDSGELPGMFNWAIAGLAQLREQGDFAESKLCQDALHDYRTEANPARAFLEEHCRAVEHAQTLAAELYTAYKKFCSENGYRPLSERPFGKEVRRVFFRVTKRRLGNSEGRFYSYFGLELFNQDDFHWTHRTQQGETDAN